MFVKLKSFYMASGAQPGEVIELDDETAKRLIAGKGACECDKEECPNKVVKKSPRRRKVKDAQLQDND